MVPVDLVSEPSIATLGPGYEYDAVDPAGEVLFVIERGTLADPTHYVVRQYDVKTQSLVPGIVVNKSGDVIGTAEDMVGSPVARVISDDGTMISTLYVRPTSRRSYTACRS